jgi:hypothetical protein
MRSNTIDRYRVQRQALLLRVDSLSVSLCGTGGPEFIPPVFPPTNYFQCGGNKNQRPLVYCYVNAAEA